MTAAEVVESPLTSCIARGQPGCRGGLDFRTRARLLHSILYFLEEDAPAMKVICDRAALADAVNIVGGVVATRSPSPVLLCVKLSNSRQYFLRVDQSIH